MTAASTVIGRYQIVDRLGQGGMGTLYLARDPMLDRLVAIKVLRVEFEDDELRERFAREARSISRLRHPNIVTIFEYGDHKGQPFIVMEYISGESMAEMIARRADMTVGGKLQMIEELCAGMAYAHRAKIVHRDIKPANIMLDDESGSVKILDFGIARDLESSLTRFTQVIGTPSYMSPEQAAGRRLDHRSDIFSIGSVFYELLSNRRAFEGDSQPVVLDRIANAEPVALSDLCPRLDPMIMSIVERALQKDPAKRYQDLEAMRADLVRARERGQSASESTIVSGRPQPLTSPTPRPPSQLEKRRASQIKLYFDTAAIAFQNGDFDAAIESCEQVLLLDESDAAALALLDKARGAQEQRLIDEHVQRARGHLNDQALTQAEDALAEALKLRTLEPAAVALQRELQVARREQERARQRVAAAEMAIGRARVSLEEGAFESAIRAASEVLAYVPDSAEAHALKDRALAGLEKRRQQEALDRRAAEAVQAARQQFNRGDRREAIAGLERFESPHPVVEEALSQLRADLEAIAARQRADEDERRRRREEERQREQLDEARRKEVSSLLAQARQRIASGAYEAALDTLLEVERLDATTRDLPQLRALAAAGIAAAEAEARRRREIAATLETAATLLDAHKLDEALAHVDAALGLDPDEAAAGTLRARIQTALAERRQEHERRARSVVEEARRHFAQGGEDAAIASLERWHPPHPIVDEALADLRAQAQAATRARQEEAERRSLVDEQRRRAEELRKIEETVISRHEQQDWARQLAAARAAIEREQFDDAFRMLEELRRDVPDAPGVPELWERATTARVRQQEATRAREVDRRLELARESIAAGEFSAALRDIDGALAVDGAHTTAQALRRDAIRALDEQRRAEEAAEQSRAREAAIRGRADQIATVRRAIETQIAQGDVEQAERMLIDAERNLDAGTDLRQVRNLFEANRKVRHESTSADQPPSTSDPAAVQSSRPATRTPAIPAAAAAPTAPATSSPASAYLPSAPPNTALPMPTSESVPVSAAAQSDSEQFVDRAPAPAWRAQVSYYVTAGVAAVLIVMAVVFVLKRSQPPPLPLVVTQEQKTQPIGSPQPTRSPVPPPPAPHAAVMVSVTLDARPWARVRLNPTTGDGQDLRCVTPCVLEVPEGDYRVFLENGGLSKEDRKQIRVKSGEAASFTFALPGFDPEAAVTSILGPTSR